MSEEADSGEDLERALLYAHVLTIIAQCDGKRPICSSCQPRRKACHYATQDNSETRLQALQREHRSLGDLLEHLRTVPAITAQAILHDLRNSDSPLSVLQRFESGQLLKTPSETTTLLAEMPQIRSEGELKLMVQHPIAYPALNLSYNSVMSKKTLVDSLPALPIGERAPDLRIASAISTLGPLDLHVRSDNSRENLKQSDESDITATQWTDALESHLDIGFWTSVPVTEHYAANAISMYLRTDHLMLRLFDAGTFLNDLIERKCDTCSPFLVSSLLAFASQAYSRSDPGATGKSLEFEKEARMLWRTDGEDSLSNLAGLVLLYISMANNRNGNEGALSYICEAGEMAKRMQLFGVRDRIATLESLLATDDAQYAFGQTAWGVFNVQQ